MGVLTNFVRKEYYKNEIQQEIRLRSPGPPSSRASMHNIFGQLSQVPMLKRHISSTSMTPVSNFISIFGANVKLKGLNFVEFLGFG